MNTEFYSSEFVKRLGNKFRSIVTIQHQRGFALDSWIHGFVGAVKHGCAGVFIHYRCKRDWRPTSQRVKLETALIVWASALVIGQIVVAPRLRRGLQATRKPSSRRKRCTFLRLMTTPAQAHRYPLRALSGTPAHAYRCVCNHRSGSLGVSCFNGIR